MATSLPSVPTGTNPYSIWEGRRKKVNVFWVFRLVQRPSGRYVVTNTKTVSIVLSLITFPVLYGYIHATWTVYLDHGSQATLTAWFSLPAFGFILHGWLVAWGLLQAYLLTPDYSDKSVVSARVANAVFVGGGAVLCLGVLAAGILNSVRGHTVWVAYRAVRTRLVEDEAAWDGTTSIAALLALQGPLSNLTKAAGRLRVSGVALYSLNAVSAFCIGLVTLFSLGLTRLLRTQIHHKVTQIQPHLPSSTHSSSTTNPSSGSPIHTFIAPWASPNVNSSVGDGAGWGLGVGTTTGDARGKRPRPPKVGRKEIRRVAREGSEATAHLEGQAMDIMALQKAERDLVSISIAVGSIAFWCTGLTVWIAWEVYNKPDLGRDWPLYEFTVTSVYWTYTIVVVVAQVVVTVNSVRNAAPKREQQRDERARPGNTVMSFRGLFGIGESSDEEDSDLSAPHTRSNPFHQTRIHKPVFDSRPLAERVTISFDFINVAEFHATSCTTRLQYLWFYILVIKSFAVYVADVYTGIALLASNHWSGSILQSAAANNGSTSSSVLEVPFNIGKWIFTGCIIFSFLLLAWEARKARAIIKSRDISYAFTNVMSNNWYSMRSYDHFCFFCQINNSKKKKDEFAFFVFFTFKGWKRLLLADAPRQVINGITLYSFGKAKDWTTDFSDYTGGSIYTAGVIITMIFSVVVWVGSAILLLIAAAMYVPLLCYIQGNLKEYCCHKVDKRIAELMRRKTRKRLAKEAEIARKEAAGDYSHLRDKKTGKMIAAPLPQPTLPKIGLRDDDLYAGSDAGSVHGSQRTGSQRGGYGYPPARGIGPGSYVPTGFGMAGAPVGRQQQQPSGLARTAYPYNGSEPDFSRHEYAESVNSLDGFAGRGAAMGYADSRENLAAWNGSGDLGRPELARGGTMMSRAPSYRSDGVGEPGDWGNEKGGNGYGGGYEYDRSGVASPPPALSHSTSQSRLQHQPSLSSLAPDRSSPFARQNSQREPYAPPSRDVLYSRAAAARASEGSLAYDRDDLYVLYI
ncbi:hypothetical protein MNV49_000491 [Pseudohyphozyma bogoriensis]|nr:hypothetical protein MNV49_000491 [Pseudohyphozyma bogoriensis]